MAHVIINEGHGPRTVELAADRTTVGSTPDCDIVLEGQGTEGCQLTLERNDGGHRVVVLTGEIQLNESPCEVADLGHKDTLRIGESMILYKNPDAVGETRADTADIAAGEAAETAPDVLLAVDDVGELQDLGLDDIEDLEDLGDLEVLDELDDVEDVEAPGTNPDLGVQDEAVDLDGADALDVDDAADEADEPAVLDAPDELDVSAEVEAQEHLDPVEGLAASRADPASKSDGVSAPVSRPAAQPAPARASGRARFRRPLPPGCKEPGSPPPAHPGRPPA